MCSAVQHRIVLKSEDPIQKRSDNLYKLKSNAAGTIMKSYVMEICMYTTDIVLKCQTVCLHKKRLALYPGWTTLLQSFMYS